MRSRSRRQLRRRQRTVTTKTRRRGEKRRTVRGDTGMMAIVSGGGGTARGVVRGIETTVTGTAIGQGHATDGETAIESATGGATVHEAANTGDETTVLNLEENASRTRDAHDHAHARESAAGVTTRGAGHHTRQRGDETKRLRSCLEYSPHNTRRSENRITLTCPVRINNSQSALPKSFYLPTSFLARSSEEVLNHTLNFLARRPLFPALHSPPCLSRPPHTMPSQHESPSVVQHRPATPSKLDASRNDLLDTAPQHLHIHVLYFFRLDDLHTEFHMRMQRDSGPVPQVSNNQTGSTSIQRPVSRNNHATM